MATEEIRLFYSAIASCFAKNRIFQDKLLCKTDQVSLDSLGLQVQFLICLVKIEICSRVAINWLQFRFDEHRNDEAHLFYKLMILGYR